MPTPPNTKRLSGNHAKARRRQKNNPTPTFFLNTSPIEQRPNGAPQHATAQEYCTAAQRSAATTNEPMSNTASDPGTMEASPDPTPPDQPLNTYLPTRVRILLGLSTTRQLDLEAGSHNAAHESGTITTTATFYHYLGYYTAREGGMTCGAEQQAAEAQPPQPQSQAQPDPVLPLWWRRKPGESRT